MEAKMQLKALMANMFAMGLLDNQFQQLQMLQDRSAPGFIAEIITLFYQEGWRTIGELAKMFVGARRVKNTCIQFREFCQANSRDGCLKTLDSMRNDFYDLHIKFQTMVQLEQQVRTFYPNQ